MRNSSPKPKLSLIERAAEVYDFGAALRDNAPVIPVGAESLRETAPVTPQAGPPIVTETGVRHAIDRDGLRQKGFLDPEAQATALSEEFRIVKRQVLAHMFDAGAKPNDRLVLINSAHPGDGKSWTAINLALSLSVESDLEVLLIDADFGKPSICKELGLPANGPGLMDALVNPSLDVEQFVMRTDLPALSVLSSGPQRNDDTEVLASDRTRMLLQRLTANRPRRVVLLDSPPALAASAASELARHVGLVLMVVRADRTSDVALRDAAHLLSACPNIQAVLNGVKFSSSGRAFGAYYGKQN